MIALCLALILGFVCLACIGLRGIVGAVGVVIGMLLSGLLIALGALFGAIGIGCASAGAWLSYWLVKK